MAFGKVVGFQLLVWTLAPLFYVEVLQKIQEVIKVSKNMFANLRISKLKTLEHGRSKDL